MSVLSERGLAVVEKLIENNHRPITSKALALSLGVSERSVKTYIKEVSDFCAKKAMVLNRTPGIGFVADFTEEQIADLEKLLHNKAVALSQQQRVNYIAYILLSGWDTYTVALFSEELSVSKNVINDDIRVLESELESFGISVTKTAGHGISVSGEEFSIRKALRHMSYYSLENRGDEATYDHRIPEEESALWVDNFSQKNYQDAIDILHHIEGKHGVLYTDYSAQMLVEYLTIQLFRLRNGHMLEAGIAVGDRLSKENENPLKISPNGHIFGDTLSKTSDNEEESVTEIWDETAYEVVQIIEKLVGNKLSDGEVDYVRILLDSSTLQEGNAIDCYSDEAKEFGRAILEYLSQIMGINLIENELLITSIESFAPSSLIRTRYGIEVTNPFLQDITEMYSGIFATCFTLSRLYEEYTGNMPSDHEIAFIALLVGGALHRTPQSIRAILIGTAGLAAANIVAAKIENRISDINIVAILTSEKINQLEDYEYDIVLSMIPGHSDDDRVLQISPTISSKDEKAIRDRCAELKSDYSTEKNEFSKLIEAKNIIFIEKKISKKEVLKEACQKLIDDDCVSKDFLKDVLEREKVESTAIGNAIAIPHGKANKVITPKICVVRLAEPLNWGNMKVDIIFLLALNFENMITTKAFFRDFTRVLSEKESLAAIKSARDSLELEGVLKAKLHWI